MTPRYTGGLRLPAEVGVDQPPDVLGHGKAEGGGMRDDDLFVGGGKAQRTLPVAVAVLFVPLPVRFLSGYAHRHDGIPFHSRYCYQCIATGCIVLLSVYHVKRGTRHRQRRAAGWRGETNAEEIDTWQNIEDLLILLTEYRTSDQADQIIQEPGRQLQLGVIFFAEVYCKDGRQNPPC